MATSYSTFLPLPDDPAAVDFRCTSLGIDFVYEGLYREPAGSPEWLLVLFLSDTSAVIDGQTVDLPAPSFLIWPPHTPLHYGHPERRFRHHWLRCLGHEVPGWLTDSRLPLKHPLALPAQHECDGWWQLLRGELDRSEGADTRIMVHLFCILLQHVRRLTDASDAGSIPEPLLRSKWHIEAHFREALDVGGLAAMADLSKAHYSTRFQAAFGIAPMAYCIQLRLRHAVLLLGNPNLSISEIAARVGYDDAFHFSKLFRKHLGCSPRAWRQGFGTRDG
jgi:AraC family transcriptional regulator, arabinose operon regulatory protein